MDFFEAQARAKQRTSRLVVMFGLAIIGTIAAAYFATVFGLSTLERQQGRNAPRYQSLGAPVSLWQPRQFCWTRPRADSGVMAGRADGACPTDWLTLARTRQSRTLNMLILFFIDTFSSRLKKCFRVYSGIRNSIKFKGVLSV